MEQEGKSKVSFKSKIIKDSDSSFNDRKNASFKIANNFLDAFNIAYKGNWIHKKSKY